VKVWVGAGVLTCTLLTGVVAVPAAGSHDEQPHAAPHAAGNGIVASERPFVRAAPVVVTPPAPRPADAAPPPRPSPPVPASLALDPSLAKPQPGDTTATRQARARLAQADQAYETANQLYDQAQAQSDEATAEVAQAKVAVAAALEQARLAHARFAALVSAQYRGDQTPVEAQLLAAGDRQGFLASLAMQQIVATRNADILTAAHEARAAAEAAQVRLTQAKAAADAARRRAQAQLAVAANALAAAQQTVTQLHAADLAAAAAARASSLGAAAQALQAQALAAHAAKPRAFLSAAGPAQVIALAARALLEKAARTQTGAPVDEQAIMGAAPDLGGTVPYRGTTGTGPTHALARFDGVLSTSGWPNLGVGTKVRGTAPFQKPGDGVLPTLPPYRQGYVPLRAEVAVDAALSVLGSPYVWDAAGPRTFDCSGLTLWAWGHAGVALNHFTGDQVHEGVLVAPNELLPGDLVLFGKTLHHVGMYLGAGYMIDAPTTGDYVKVQLVADDGDFAVAVRP
jgi:NlpC/P60 family